MNEAAFKQLEKNIADAKRRKRGREVSLDSSRQVALVEPDSFHAPLGAQKVQRPTGQRVLVRVTSRRRRLLDEDNLCAKYHIDLCRYAGIIPDDSPDQVKIEVGQVKVSKGQSERTEIEISLCHNAF